MSELSKLDVGIIQEMCEEDMNSSAVARKYYFHHNTVSYHLNKIKKKTGLDPRKFHDLIKLEIIAKEYVFPEENIRYCKNCGKIIDAPKRIKYCSDNCRKTNAAKVRRPVDFRRKEMCESCEMCLPVFGSTQRICDKTKKIVISRNGKANKNCSECYNEIYRKNQSVGQES